MNHINLDEKIRSIISEVLNLGIDEQYSSILQDISEIKSEIEKKEYHITVVGEFSSGKSTFLNALIGKNILPKGVKETTATVTYVHNVPLCDPRVDSVRVEFFDDRAPETFLLNGDYLQLVPYLVKDSANDVANTVKSVTIFSHFADCDEPLVLVDTPGLNGTDMRLREITLNEIRRAHASLCLFNIKGVGRTDVESLKILRESQRVFFFILTHIDELKPEEDTYENVMTSFKNNITQYVYDGKQEPDKVFGISSLKALVARDHSFKKMYVTDQVELSETKRKELFNSSGFSELYDSMIEYVSGNKKEREFYSSIILRLLGGATAIKDSISSDRKCLEVNRDDLPKIAILRKAKADVNNIMEANRRAIGYMVGGRLSDLKTEVSKLITSDIDAKKTELTGMIDSLSTFKEVEDSLKQREFENKVTGYWISVVSKYEDFLTVKANQICEDVIRNLNERMPKVKFRKIDNSRIIVEIYSENVDTPEISDRIGEMEKKIQNLDREISVLEEGSQDLKKKKTQKAEAESQLRNLMSELAYKKSELGSRPEPKTVTIMKTVERHGFFGHIADIFSEKKVPRQKTDTSDRDKYDVELASLKKQYSQKITSCQIKIGTYNEAIRQLEEQERVLGRKIEAKAKMIEKLDALINEKSEYERVAQSTLIKKNKENIKKMLNHFLGAAGEYTVSLKNNVNASLSRIQELMETRLKSYYDSRIKEYKKQVDLMIEKLENNSSITEDKAKLEWSKATESALNNIIITLNTLDNELSGRIQSK